MDTLNHEKSNNLVPDQVANPQLDSPSTQLQKDAGIVVPGNQRVDHMGLKQKKNVVSNGKKQIHMYFEKATKFEKNLPPFLKLLSDVKKKWEIFTNFH